MLTCSLITMTFHRPLIIKKYNKTVKDLNVVGKGPAPMEGPVT